MEEALQPIIQSFRSKQRKKIMKKYGFPKKELASLSDSELAEKYPQASHYLSRKDFTGRYRKDLTQKKKKYWK